MSGKNLVSSGAAAAWLLVLVLVLVVLQTDFLQQISRCKFSESNDFVSLSVLFAF
jgi:hypothetical protein